MAVLPPLKRFVQEDYSGSSSVSSFIEKFFYPLNLFLNSVYSALNNGLTLGANSIAVVSTPVQVKNDATGVATTTINWPFPQTPPIGVVVMSCRESDVSVNTPLMLWSYNAGVITVDLQFYKVSGSNLVIETALKTFTISFWATGG